MYVLIKMIKKCANFEEPHGMFVLANMTNKHANN